MLLDQLHPPCPFLSRLRLASNWWPTVCHVLTCVLHCQLPTTEGLASVAPMIGAPRAPNSFIYIKCSVARIEAAARLAHKVSRTQIANLCAKDNRALIDVSK